MAQTPTGLIEHGRLVELCTELFHTSLAITPALSLDDRLHRVMAAASCLTESPDSWLAQALEQALQQIEGEGF